MSYLPVGATESQPGTAPKIGALYKELLSKESASCPVSRKLTEHITQAARLEKEWKPSDYYTWKEMADLLAATVRLGGSFSDAGLRFFQGNSTPSAKDRVRRAYDAYFAVARQSLDYVEKWRIAKNEGKLIHAPDFKAWAIDDLAAALRLYRTIEIEACNAPWWLDAAAATGRLINDFYESAIWAGRFAKDTGKAAAALASGAVKAARKAGDWLEYAPYVGVGVGGLLLFFWLKKKSKE